MLSHLQNFLEGNNNNNSNSLDQGKQFKFMQNRIMGGTIIEGNTNMGDQPDLLVNLDTQEMDKIQQQTNDKSDYNKLLSDCGTSVKLYNDELSKTQPDYDGAESLRNNMKQTCALLDSSIRKFRDDVSNLEKQKNNLGINIDNNSSPTLERNLIDLKVKNSELSSKIGMDNTLDGEIENNRLLTQSVYIKYFAWMFASVTMASIVVQQLLKD
jgi:hypothetical protein